jgi:dTDP-4-amino-4,6-dideoxygalactose transaminase
MINLFQPDVTEESLNNLRNVFKSNWLGRGDLVKEFENKFTTFIGNKNIHTIASASNGIDGVFDIFPFEKGDEIIIPTNSFPIIASSAKLRGITIRIADINRYTGNISLESLEQLLTSRTKAVFITHYGGIPLNIESLRKVVGKDILIFEDSACALGTKINSVSCGNDADFSVWSFDAMKLVVCGEGGAIHFKSSEKLEEAKEYFYLGLPNKSKSGLDSAKEGGIWWEYDLNRLGVRSVFTNVNAAIGIPQIMQIDQKLQKKKEIARTYDENLHQTSIDHRARFLESNVEYSNYFYTIQSDRRDDLARYLLDNGVYSSLRYSSLHNMRLFEGDKLNEYPGAEHFFSKSLNIPIHSSLEEADIEKIINLIRKFDVHFSL